MILKKTNKNLKKSKGISLIGVLIAIFILSTSVVSGLVYMKNAIKNTSVTKHEITASFLAEEGVELMKNIRDTGDTYCMLNYSSLDGFSRIAEKANATGSPAYSIDNTIDTFRNKNQVQSYLNSHQFNNNNAGLCENGNEIFVTCNINSDDPNYFRKIQLFSSAAAVNDCATVQGSSGIKVISTVYWFENYEVVNFTNVSDAPFTDDTNTMLHKVRTGACLYDWRPR